MLFAILPSLSLVVCWEKADPLVISYVILSLSHTVSCVRCQGGGGAGTLIFSHIRRLGVFFGVQNLEFRYIFYYFIFFLAGGGGGGPKNMNIFWGMQILCIFFLRSSQKGSSLCILVSFLEVNVQNGDIFRLLKFLLG